MKLDWQIFFICLLAAGLILAGCGGNTTGPVDHYPQIGVSEDTLDFGLSGMERSLIVYNTGVGTLSWMLMVYPSWLDPSVNSGSLPTSASDTAIFEIGRFGLDEGQNEADIILDSNGGTLTLTALAEQSAGPVLAELPDQLDFGAYQDSLELIVHNAGGEALEWAISISDPYFSASLQEDSTTWQTSVWIRLDRDNAPQGELSAQLDITSNGGSAQIELRAEVGVMEGHWLSYSGDAYSYYSAQPEDYFFIVRFDRPEYWIDFKVSRIRVQLHTLMGAYDDIQFWCWSVSQDPYGRLWPAVEQGPLYVSSDVNPEQGWNEWSVDWPLNQSTFCLGYFQYDYFIEINPDPYYDIDAPLGRSYRMYQVGEIMYDMVVYNWEWCLEVYVEPLATVAGFGPGGTWLQSRAALIQPVSDDSLVGCSRRIVLENQRFSKSNLR